jgi:hypothetical protein
MILLHKLFLLRPTSVRFLRMDVEVMILSHELVFLSEAKRTSCSRSETREAKLGKDRISIDAVPTQGGSITISTPYFIRSSSEIAQGIPKVEITQFSESTAFGIVLVPAT